MKAKTKIPMQGSLLFEKTILNESFNIQQKPQINNFGLMSMFNLGFGQLNYLPRKDTM